jgi:hypothetical protein
MKYSTHFSWDLTEENFCIFLFSTLFKMTKITKTCGNHQEQHLLRAGQLWQAENYPMT